MGNQKLYQVRQEKDAIYMKQTLVMKMELEQEN